jgi:hypothetical protein
MMKGSKMINKQFLGASILAMAALMEPACAITNEELLKRMEALESEVKEAKKQNAEFKNQISGLESGIKSQIQKELGAVEDRIDGVETSVLMNKVNLGLGFRSRVDSYNAKRVNGTTAGNDNVWTTKLHLNMDSQITDNMKFSGRLAMYKYWGGNTAIGNNQNMSGYDPMQGRRPADSAVFAERAYVDYIIDKEWAVPVTFTIGRQPSSDGPSHQFKDNTVRKSTYSALGFDGAADGVVTTLDLQKATGMENAAVRLAYGKGYQAYNTTNGNTQYIDSSNGVKDTQIYGMFIDGAIPSVKGSLLQLGYVKAKDVTGMTGGANLGSIDLIGAMAEFTNIAGSGVDLFAHYGLSRTDSNANTVNVGDGNGAIYGLLGDSAHANLNEKHTGNAFWLGGRYTLPFANSAKIGYEYNRGSQYWISFTNSANDLTNKLAARGNAHEVYYIQPINRYAYLRAGAQFIKYDYAGSGSHLGTPMKLGDAGTDAQIKELTNYYLLFNLLF